MSKVLIVDDELNCQILANQLKPYGYDVIFATEGGEQGILFAVTQSPDLILVSADLPVINGWQTINILKASVVTHTIPVVALISPTEQQEWHMAIASTCDDYCLKPVALNHLLGKVERLLGHTHISTPIQSTEISTVVELSERQSLPVPFSKTADLRRPLGAAKKSWEKFKGRPIFNADTSEYTDAPMVVYVEDYVADSQTMATIVKTAGCQYANIADSLDVLPQLLELKPALVFLDLVMPVVNGYELCAQIRRISAFKTTPVIIVTNNDGIADRVRARTVGASGFLGKPINKHRVNRTLKKYLKPRHFK